MIIDMDLKGCQVVVVGAGKEAIGKVESLVSENCKVTVIAEKIADPIRKLFDDKKIDLRVARVMDGEFLDEFDRLILLMAVTSDNKVNRLLVDKARALGCLAYSVDDASYSDFAYPATINLYDTIQIAISTGGRSPLMARKIKETAEPVLRQCIGPEDALQAQLQGRLREAAKHKLEHPALRKQYLYGIYDNVEIRRLLSLGKIREAESLAIQILDHFV